MKSFFCRPIYFVSMVVLSLPGVSDARTNSLYGSASLSTDYDSNVYRTHIDEVSGWSTKLSPTIRLTSEGQSDSMSFSYSPGLRYDDWDDHSSVDHELMLGGEKSLSSRLKVLLSDNFRVTEEPVQDEKLGIVVSEDTGRDRYKANYFSSKMEYEYFMENILWLGY